MVKSKKSSKIDQLMNLSNNLFLLNQAFSKFNSKINKLDCRIRRLLKLENSKESDDIKDFIPVTETKLKEANDDVV